MDAYGMDGVTMYALTSSMAQSFRTGNPILDTAIAMLIPFLLTFILSSFSALKDFAFNINYRRFFRFRKLYEYKITSEEVEGVVTTYNPGDNKNAVLVKAIQHYNDHCKIFPKHNVSINLSSDDRTLIDMNDDQSPSLSETLKKYRIVKKLPYGEFLKLGKYGKEKERKYQVKVCFAQYTENLGSDTAGQRDASGLYRRITREYYFESYGKDSIDTYLDKAYEWYVSSLESLDDDGRFLYEVEMEPRDNDSLDEKEDGNERRKLDKDYMKYRRYKLTDDKTFESMFFTQKDPLIKIVDNFTQKKGKYAVKGYPQKLGLLLHGPPGTGKTSLVKALAHKTGRSVVNVPLSKISTNTELYNLFFNQKYHVGKDLPVTLTFKDVIFVMEDVDAVSNVVRRRDGRKTGGFTLTQEMDIQGTKNLWMMVLESTNEDCQKLVGVVMESSEKLSNYAKKPEIVCAIARRLGDVPGLGLVGEDTNDDSPEKNAADKAIEEAEIVMENEDIVNNFLGMRAKALLSIIDRSGGVVDEKLEEELLKVPEIRTNNNGTVSFKTISNKEGDNIVLEDDSKLDDKYKKGRRPRQVMDALNLSGLLNVLDGVVDTPGRMLVMTTNHPEVLDPALIRPGRIDKKLLLTYVTWEDMAKMIEHYFQEELDDAMKARLKKAVLGTSHSKASTQLKLTPAQVEQMACEHDAVEDIVSTIEKMVATEDIKSFLPPPRMGSQRQISFGV